MKKSTLKTQQLSNQNLSEIKGGAGGHELTHVVQQGGGGGLQ